MGSWIGVVESIVGVVRICCKMVLEGNHFACEDGVGLEVVETEVSVVGGDVVVWLAVGGEEEGNENHKIIK